MTEQDLKQFSEELAKTAEAFKETLTPGRIDTYFDDLSDLSLEAVLVGLQYARRTLTFFPKIAELRNFAEGSASDRAELAWRTFVDLIKFEGAYPSLYVYDGAIAYAIECFGGWQTACAKLNDASVEMVANYEKHFKNSYKLGVVRGEQPKYLVGETESNNRGLGAWKSPTIDQAVCLVKPGKVVKVVMPFELAQGRLTAEARKALESGANGNGLRKYLPEVIKVEPPALPAASELATPEDVEEIRQSVKAFARRSSNVVSIADRKAVSE